MIRRPPRSTLSSSSAASDVYKRQVSTQSTGKRALEDHAQSTPPLFILGHSMGGLIGAHAAQRASQGELAGFRGAVLSGPALTPDPEIAGPMLIKVGGVLSEMFPKVPLDGIPAQFVSRDPVVVEHYLNDPLNYVGGIRSRVGIELLQAMDAAQDLSLIHISEPTRLLSISYAVFCLKKKKKHILNGNIR
eukprot:TRINITY_DN29296_c0_g1_i3.p1 TRINITY_DN29296_c0_g1~~TRINITY_DN29296_c0_g1_i3.p1  ORF type:complete len:190 (+),score=53.35 TRINITY_DN29296_c0_g1_i3:77-646(+)